MSVLMHVYLRVCSTVGPYWLVFPLFSHTLRKKEVDKTSFSIPCFLLIEKLLKKNMFFKNNILWQICGIYCRRESQHLGCYSPILYLQSSATYTKQSRCIIITPGKSNNLGEHVSLKLFKALDRASAVIFHLFLVLMLLISTHLISDSC